jgi:tetratricopeptide (TPR) repeat protein
MLPDEKKEELNKALYYKGKRLDSIFREAKKAADIKSYPKALELMTGVTKTIEQNFCDTAQRKFVSLRNPLEEHLYYAIFEPQARHQKPPFDFSEMYRFMGFLYVELRQIHMAVEALEKAIVYNPFNPDAYFELCEAFKLSGNMEAVQYVTKDTLKIAMSSKVLGRCYKNIGFYCVETGDFDSAVCFYYQSMRCYDDQTIIGELAHIRKQSNTQILIPSNAMIENAFKKYTMQYGANEKLLNVAYNLAKILIEKDEPIFAKYCLSIVCDLSDDDEAKELLTELEKV